jgi:ankyrin repeat protein
MKSLLLFFLVSLLASGMVCATPLIQAVENNDLITAAQLLRQGVDVNEKDTQGYTPLMIAAGYGNPQMVELLLTAGADVHILDTRMGASALHKAAQGGVVDAARLLLQHGAFLDLQAPSLGHTPLMDSVWHKKTAMAGYLLAQGARMELKTHYGFTALDFAKRDNLRDIVTLIEERQKYVETKVAAQKLCAAVHKSDLEAVKKLIRDGADVNEKSLLDGYTPLLTAARLGYADIVRELLQAGANVRIVDDMIKATAGHKAGYMGHPDVARLVVRRHVELDAQGPYNGYTALHDAIWHGHSETAKVFVEAGARLDLRGHDGKTPLELAQEYGYSDIVAMLEARLKGGQNIAENDVKSFVYQWFSWFDHQADESNFLTHLANDELLIQFPETALHNHQEFRQWYAGIRKNIQSNSHGVGEVDVTKNDQGGFDVELQVHWQARTYDGKELDMQIEQSWQLSVENGRLVIHRYIVRVE